MSKARNKTKRRPQNQPKGWLIAAMVAVAVLLSAAFLLRGRLSASPSQTGALPSLPAEISVQQAAEMRDAGAFVLDVRQPEEWDEYHIPATTLIPLEQLESRLNEVPRDREVVVVCRSGNRSQAGRDILRQAGYTQVTSMAGGLKGWMAAGLEWVSGP